MIDCGFDDPLDKVSKNNYVNEVASFTNIAQLCVYDPLDNIIDRLKLMSNNSLQVALSIQGIFFEGKKDKNQGSGTKYTLYPNYKSRWNKFVEINKLSGHISEIGMFYIADEPLWNGIKSSEIKVVADFLKSNFPNIPIGLTEASSKITETDIPSSIDWIGVVHYAIAHPDTDSILKDEISLLKSKRSNLKQKILLIMDSQWLPFYGQAGYSPAYMASVATGYYNLAISDPDIIAIIGYTWPGGFDDPKQKGLRNLPTNVLNEHIRIGKIITGK